jgi:hypothetical protein
MLLLPWPAAQVTEGGYLQAEQHCHCLQLCAFPARVAEQAVPWLPHFV